MRKASLIWDISNGGSMAKISEEEKTALLSQWQTCVEMTNSISERRDNMNNLFVTLNLAIIATISFMWDTKTIALLVGDRKSVV